MRSPGARPSCTGAGTGSLGGVMPKRSCICCLLMTCLSPLLAVQCSRHPPIKQTVLIEFRFALLCSSVAESMPLSRKIC